MKRVAAILLMGILLFNWVGYQLLTAYWESRANTRLEAQIDENGYDESQLISVKIPAGHLSSYTNAGQFERVDGQVEIGGMQYKYVKRRLYNDSLELLCIPNRAATGLLTARNEFFKLVNDLQQDHGTKSNQHPSSSRNFSGEYYTVDEIFAFPGERYFTVLPAHADRPDAGICSTIILTEEQPPDLLS